MLEPNSGSRRSISQTRRTSIGQAVPTERLWAMRILERSRPRCPISGRYSLGSRFYSDAIASTRTRVKDNDLRSRLRTVICSVASINTTRHVSRTVQKPKLEQKWFLRSNVRCCVSATKKPLGKAVMFVCEGNTYPRTENIFYTALG